MVSPQVEDGYTRVANSLYEHLYKLRISGLCKDLIAVIIRKTYGYQKKTDKISAKQFCKELDLPYTHSNITQIFRSLKNLEQRNIILVNRESIKKVATYSIQKNYEMWVFEETINKKVDSSINKNDDSFDKTINKKVELQKKYIKENKERYSVVN
jgi:phage replication O-like protein O